jgi:hypothetical protein
MPKETNIDFVSIIRDVFDPVFQTYDLKLQDETTWNGQGENLLTAAKDGLEVIFYLANAPLFYYGTVALHVVGDLAKRATPHSKYHSLDIATIAEELGPQFKPSMTGAQTNEEVRALFEVQKEILLKYCSDILAGEVSSWTRVSERLRKNRRK